MAEIPDVLTRSLARRLDFLAGYAAAARGTFELVENDDDGYQAMILPCHGAARVGEGKTCSAATRALLNEIY